MEKNTIKLYNNKAYGMTVSAYGLENGYLDYETLSRIIGDCILNNTIYHETAEDWEIISGSYEEEIFQFYIISDMLSVGWLPAELFILFVCALAGDLIYFMLLDFGLLFVY